MVEVIPLSRAPSDDRIAAVRAALDARPDGVLETIAQEAGVSLRTVLDCITDGSVRRVSGDRFAEIWAELTGWGTVLMIVHTRDGVFEIKAPLPPGTAGQGYFNVHGDSPIGGHIRADRCAAVYFVDRPFFGRRSCSIQFMSVDGDAMFKIFVARDAARALDPGQLARFEAFRAAIAEG